MPVCCKQWPLMVWRRVRWTVILWPKDHRPQSPRMLPLPKRLVVLLSSLLLSPSEKSVCLSPRSTILLDLLPLDLLPLQRNVPRVPSVLGPGKRMLKLMLQLRMKLMLQMQRYPIAQNEYSREVYFQRMNFLLFVSYVIMFPMSRRRILTLPMILEMYIIYLRGQTSGLMCLQTL